MREIVLKQAMDVALSRLSDDNSLFLTPEHLLLIFLGDSSVRILLAGLNIAPEVLTEMVKEYVNGLPRSKGRVLQPIFSWGFPGFKARLAEMGLDWKKGHRVSALHFLEAYAHCNSLDSVIPPCMPGLVLGQRYQDIELAVYGHFPKH